jgi:hypothetical protein
MFKMSVGIRQDNVGVEANLCHHHAHVQDVCGDVSHSSMLIGRVVNGCSLQDNFGVAANLCHHHAHVQDVCGDPAFTCFELTDGVVGLVDIKSPCGYASALLPWSAWVASKRLSIL